MKSDRAIIIPIRLLWVPISGVVLFQITQIFVKSINDIAYAVTEDTYDIWFRYRDVELAVLTIVLMLVFAHLTLEVIAIFHQPLAASRAITNLRFGPLAVLLVFAIVVPLFDVAMIEVSKYQIRSYIFQVSESIEEPEVTLHNNYRHWCGNGASAQEEYLYFDTTAMGVAHESPHVRARSLLMTARVRDFLNGPDPRFKGYLKAACHDPDPLVVQTAEDLFSRSNLSCARPDYLR